MRRIVFAVMAVLAMTGVTYGVTFGVVENPEAGAGLKSFTVQATGTGINTLGMFTVTGNINQTDGIWVGDGSSAGGATDSCILFGDVLIPGTGGVSVETGSGLNGTLNNYSATGGPGGTPTWDDYLQTGTPSTTDVTVDLLQLIIGTGEQVTVDMTVWTATGVDFLTIDSYTDSLVINAPWDGDANSDGYVDGIDGGRLGLHWNDTPGTSTWADGDFNGDGDVNGIDGGRVGLHWHQYAEWYVPPSEGSPVPEPSTIVMLVLGALCLAGYRLRK